MKENELRTQATTEATTAGETDGRAQPAQASATATEERLMSIEKQEEVIKYLRKVLDESPYTVLVDWFTTTKSDRSDKNATVQATLELRFLINRPKLKES